jgi:hypothetical protein
VIDDLFGEVCDGDAGNVCTDTETCARDCSACEVSAWLEGWDSAIPNTYYGVENLDGVYFYSPDEFTGDNGTYTFTNADTTATTIISLVQSRYAKVTSDKKLILAALPSVYNPGTNQDPPEGWTEEDKRGGSGKWNAQLRGPSGMGIDLSPNTVLSFDGSAITVDGGNDYYGMFEVKFVDATSSTLPIRYLFSYSPYFADYDPLSIPHYRIGDISNFGSRNLWNDFQDVYQEWVSPSGFKVDQLVFTASGRRWYNLFGDIRLTLDNINIGIQSE